MEYLYGFLGFVIFMVVLRIWHVRRDRKRHEARPPRHLGDPQSQRGRVYKNPPSTNHSSDPYSGWG